MHPTDHFRDAIVEHGLTPPDVIEPGRLHRFPGVGKSNGNRAGWCKLFADGMGGVFGDWSNDLHEVWQAQRDKPLSACERAEWQRQIAEAKRQAEAERAKAHQEAATRAADLWNEAQPAPGDHPYLTTKRVLPYGVRQHDSSLVIPMRDSGGVIKSLQFISGDGSKKFLAGGRVSGCYYSIGQPRDVICIAEGFATAASIHEATGYAVAAAFNAGNLADVASTLRKKLPDCRLIICADNDENKVGQTKAREAAEAVTGLVAIPPEVGDFNDLLQAHGVEAVRNCIADTLSGDREMQAGDTSIAELAELPPLEYEQQRKAEAKRLGIRATALDLEVKQYRQQAERANGEAGLFPEVEPWPHPVSGAELLQALSDSAKRFLTLPEHGDIALSMWAVFTHLIDAAEVSPILAITAPEKRCGKTTTLHWLGGIVAKPLPASNMTAAVVFRAVEKWQPTLLIDEADTFLQDSDELRGVLNSGHSRQSAFVIRTVGDDYEPRQFSTWSAKAIAMIGKLPDTLADRAINIEMRRKLPHERIEKMRDAGDHFMELQRKCARFAMDHVAAVENARPEIPATLNDRAADNWHTLLAIADMAGGDWPTQARTAAAALSGVQDDTDSINQELLADIKAAFESENVTRLRTAELIEVLCQDDESPWPHWNRGKPITGRQLARRLREFGITPNQTFRFGDSTAKGYSLHQFTDAFARYLPVSVTRSQTNSGAASSVIAIGNAADNVTDEKTLKRSTGAGCDRVTDNAPPDGGMETF